MNRRVFLRLSGLGILGIAGCVRQPTKSSPTQTPGNETDELDIHNVSPANSTTFESWEPETNCNQEPQSMYNSEISVITVRDEISDKYKPVAYESLPIEQKEILVQVLENGGYATCETSDAFNNFLETAVLEHARKQDAEDTTVYLEYNDMFYQLKIRKQDQVYAY